MEFKGTKGQWEIFKLQDKIIGISTNLGINGNIICEMPTMKNSCKNWDANALLISKAPEMLEMLKYIVNEGMLDVGAEILVENLIKQATEI